MSQWEYETIGSEAENNKQLLNDAGANGWELVSVIFREGNDIVSDSWMFYFKRPKTSLFDEGSF